MKLTYTYLLSCQNISKISINLISLKCDTAMCALSAKKVYYNIHLKNKKEKTEQNNAVQCWHRVKENKCSLVIFQGTGWQSI